MSEVIEYPEIGRIYKHYKGGLYEVITMATHSETDEPVVVYKSLLFGSVHVRPVSMWFDVIMSHSTATRTVYRFLRVPSDTIIKANI